MSVGPAAPGRTRHAVVTGAGGGIGACVATELAGAGYAVLGIDLAFGDGVSGVEQVVLDITDAAAVERLAARELDRWIDVIVNCAAIRPTGSILQVEVDAWRACFEVNVTGAYLVSRAFLPRLAAPASIVNVASAAAYGRKNLAAYGASKAALLSLTRSMALDHAAGDIRVNAVLPGTTATPMVEAMTGLPVDKMITREAARTTAGLMLRAGDVARGILDVIANSSLMTGAIVPIGLLPYEW